MKAESVVAWLLEHATWHESMPNSPHIKLSYPTRKAVFDEYLEDCKRSHDQRNGVDRRPCSEATFRLTWHKHPQLQHITVRKGVSSRVWFGLIDSMRRCACIYLVVVNLSVVVG